MTAFIEDVENETNTGHTHPHASTPYCTGRRADVRGVCCWWVWMVVRFVCVVRRRAPPLFAAATGIAALGQYCGFPLVLLLERTRLEARVAPPTALGSDDARLIVGRGGGDGSHLHRRRSHGGFGRHRLGLSATTAHEDQGEDKSDDADDGADDGADDDPD